jgi:hypothetical protein
MISPYWEALNRVMLAEEMLRAGAPLGATSALDEASRLAKDVDGDRREYLRRLITIGRSDVAAQNRADAAALPRWAAGSGWTA